MPRGEQTLEDHAAIADALLVQGRILGFAGTGGLGVDGHGGDEGFARLPEVLARALLEHLGGFTSDGAPLALEVERAGIGRGAGGAGSAAREGVLRVGPVVTLGVLGAALAGRVDLAGDALGRLLGQEVVAATLEHDGGPAERVGGAPHVVVRLLVEAALN